MLSVESPPPDPSCPSDSSQLKDVSDERPSHELTLPEVDLSKPPVLGETQLPKFSIRDYVFASRSKDIKINWPFSLKNLQLCFKHGVKEPLPPFQHFDAVKNQSLRKCLVDDKNISNNITEEPSEPEDDDYAALDSNHNTQLKAKLTETCAINSTTSWRCSEGDHNDFPSTVTSVAHFEIEESVPTHRPNSSVLLATTDTYLETSVEAEAAAAAAGPSVTHKLESTTRPSGKKCRLVVKFGAQTDRSSAEDIASNSTTTVSETMASKICPVCKTFSSSSNTTLNAHIDQCLSVESTPKWTVDSKMTRHRIKHRKNRTMVDIYSTASHCTLEDLHRRNGSNWATISSFPTQDKEKRSIPAEEKKQRVPPLPSDNSTVDIGAVYIDENGTKVRILSKFDDVLSVSPLAPKVLECGRPSNPMKVGKGSKLFSTKNKKSHGVKYNKYLRPGRPSKKLFSSKGHSSQIFGDQARHYGEKETYEECGREKRVSPGNSVALRQWACSKRTGVAKKLGNSVSSQLSQCKWPVSQELQAVSDQSSLHTSLMRQSSEREFTKVSVSPISSPGNSVGTVSVSYGQQTSDKGEQSPRRKRAGSPLSGLRIRGNVKGPLQPLKQNGRHLREDSPSFVRDFQAPKTSDSTGVYKSLSRNKITGVASGLNAPSNFPSYVGKKLTRNYHASRSGAVKVSPSGKNIMSVGSKMVDSNSDGITKCSSLKKSEVHLMEGVDEELVDRDFEDDESCDFMQNPAENQYSREDNSNETSVSRRTIGESRQNAEVLSTCKRKEVTTWDSSQVESQHHQNNEEKSSVFLEQMDSVQPDCDGVRCSMDDIVAQPSYEAPFGENSELNSKLSHRSMIQSNSQHFNGALSRGEGSTEPNFFTGQGIFSSDDNILVQNVHTEEDLESGVGHGSSFPEVDPIPIPGPPGSFLPSPRDMGSEDFQGNSSLTTSRVQSPQDQQDCVDGDLSDSPVSAISMISNSAAPRYNAMYFKPTSLGHQLVEDKVRSSSRDGSFDSSVENTAQVPRSTILATERLTFDGRDIAAVNNMPLSFENDNQPCCCQRKERASQGVTLNYQESQLLKRRTMASAMVPALNRHMGCNMSSGPDNLEGRSDIWPLSSCPTSKPANLPVLKFPASPNSLRGSPDAGVKFSVRSDCDSISPSTSNSILRLMGKNLMVGNRDEDEQGLSHPQTNRLTSQLATFSGATSNHIRNQVYHSYHPNFPHGALISSQDLNNKVGKCFENTRLDNSSRSHPSLNVSQMFSEGPACLFPNLQRDGNLIGLAEPHEYKADYDIADHSDKSSMNISSAASTRHVEKTPSFSDFKPKNVLCATNTNKEMIIIDDDVPEREDKLNGDVKRYNGGLGESHVISSGVSFPTYGVNPFSCYQSQDCLPVSESPMVYNSNLHALTNSQKNASPHRWRRSSEGSGVLQQNSYLAAASPVGRMRYELL